MSASKTSIPSTFSIKNEFVEDDTRFLHICIDTMHTELNLNKSYFDKSVVNECIDSIKNTPILGFIKCNKYTDDNDFAGHEYILKRTENGVEETYAGRAFGVVPESCNPRWVVKICDDGVEREFLQVDALMWEKFGDATDILRRDGEKSESMELEVSSIDGYEDEDGIFHFTRFRFDGFCLLGDQVRPAMTGANVRINDGVNFSMGDFSDKIRRELDDKLEQFNTMFTRLVNDKNNQGGVSDMSDTNTDFSQTVIEQLDDMSIMISEYETIDTFWGETPRFYLADVQDDEVIVFDASDHWRYYGFKFTLNGDKPEIDFENGSRKKVRFEDYEEGSEPIKEGFSFDARIAEIEQVFTTKIDEAESKFTEAEAKIAEVEDKFSEVEQSKADIETEYANIKAEYDEIKPKYDEYVQAEEQREIDELNAKKDAKFAEYEDSLFENAEFAALKEKKDEMSVKEIENECSILFWKMNRPKNSFSKEDSKSAVLGVIGDSDDVADGYVHTKYGNVRKVR